MASMATLGLASFSRIIQPTAAAPSERPGRRSAFRNDMLGRAGHSMDISALRALAQAHPESFVRRFNDLVEKGVDGKRERRFTLSSIPDIKSFFRAFFDLKVRTEVEIAGTRAAVDTSAFPMMVGSLTVDALNSAYDRVPTIGQELVRDADSNKKFSHFAKIQNLVSGELEVKEGDEFPMMSAGEEFSVIGHKRKGVQLALSMELIEESDLSGFIDLVDQCGEFAAELIEEQTLSRVFDQNGSASSAKAPYAYNLNNVNTALYTTTADSPGAQAPSGTRILNNPCSTSSNLEAARVLLNKMLNTRLKRIAIPMSETLCVVPDAVLTAMLKIVRSELEPGVLNEQNNWGPQGSFRPGLVSSPKIDDISTSAWLYGAPTRQFVRKHKLRLETVSVFSDPMTYLKTREAYRSRVAWDVEVGARDYVYVIQNLSGDTSTIPAAATTGI